MEPVFWYFTVILLDMVFLYWFSPINNRLIHDNNQLEKPNGAMEAQTSHIHNQNSIGGKFLIERLHHFVLDFWLFLMPVKSFRFA